VALDLLPDFFAHRFLWFSFYFVLILVVRHVEQTKLASSVVNFWAHDNIMIDSFAITCAGYVVCDAVA